ncbi:coenzyme F420-0:L-glutamate ligase [Leifsonia sp. Leaf264]|uniref:coenzyme F420-0:L-glutamate ligase n=1 Tax=Leifsonia sp. Leaf264 TaxID=1736314 RepID=UPI0006FA18E1|nr:coenzyme F420-0:L-glutamate ligase [Leifsonia sp. Leaf264]KQO95880.1 F420-dependent oxidoreductase [Leifsonia sp. Leaf264]
MYSVSVIDDIPEVRPGDDLVELIGSRVELVDGDIVVVTSKIVSKAEGRFVAADDREQAISDETVRVVATRISAEGGTTRIVQNRLGIVSAAAGVDASNTPDGTVLLLPVDPDGSARSICIGLRELSGASVGVIISDTLGRAWRQGQTDVAIGAAGVHVFDDLRGTLDNSGKPMAVTLPCIADELASAGDLVKGKTGGTPVAVVRGLGRFVGDLDLPGAATIVRPAEQDMFRTGSDEAYDEGYRDGFAEGQQETVGS